MAKKQNGDILTASDYIEGVLDGVNSMIVAGAGIDKSYDDANDNLNLSLSLPESAKSITSDYTTSGETLIKIDQVPAGYDLLQSPTQDQTNDKSGDLNGQIFDVEWKPDGTKLYVVDGDFGSDSWYVREYNLSTAWDISTATLNQTWNRGTSTTISLYISDDGDHVVIGDYNNVRHFNLGTSWDISTTSFQSRCLVTDDYSHEAVYGVSVNPDGDKIGYVSALSGHVVVLSLSTAWDFGTDSLSEEIAFGNMGGSLSSGESGQFEWNDDGTKFYVVASNSNIEQYSAQSAYSITNHTYEGDGPALDGYKAFDFGNSGKNFLTGDGSTTIEKWTGISSGGVTDVTLASADAVEGKEVTVKENTGKTPDNTISTEGSETIDGQSSIKMDTARQAVTVKSDGSNWFITGEKT